MLDLTWSYPTEGDARRADRRGGAGRDQRLERRRRDAVGLHRAQGRRLHLVRLLDLLRRLCRRRQPDRAAQARPRAELDRARVGVGVAGEPPDPVQPRLGRPGGQAVVRAQGAGLVGRGAGQVDRSRHARTSRSTSRRATGRPPDAKGPAAIAGDDPFIMQADGRGWLFAPAGRRRRAAAHPLRAAGLAGAQPAARPAAQPGAPGLRAREQPLPPRPRRRRAPSCIRSRSPPTG